jgi:hypothetical protein
MSVNSSFQSISINVAEEDAVDYAKYPGAHPIWGNLTVPERADLIGEIRDAGTQEEKLAVIDKYKRLREKN